MTTARWRSGFVPFALVAVIASGCGAAEPTIEVTPLSARLAQIDQSLAAQRFEQARRDLAALAAETKAARANGELASARADAILDAIVALRATLPAPTPTTPTTAPTPTPEPAPVAPTRPNGTSDDGKSEVEKGPPAGVPGKGTDNGAGNGKKPNR